MEFLTLFGGIGVADAAGCWGAVCEEVKGGGWQ